MIENPSDNTLKRFQRFIQQPVYLLFVVAIFLPVKVHAVVGVKCTPTIGVCALKENCDQQYVVTGPCDTNEVCCEVPPSVPAVPEAAQPKPEAAPKKPTIEGGLVLPPCVNEGNCTVDQIVETGVNFANFIMGLSGALFFIIFIYGGAMYLLSFGEKSRVEKGKAAIKGAAIGIVFVMGAWTIVRYIYTSVTGPEGAGKKASSSASTKCATDWPGYACETIGNDKSTPQEVMALCENGGWDCKQGNGNCPGGNNIICAKKK